METQFHHNFYERRPIFRSKTPAVRWFKEWYFLFLVSNSMFLGHNYCFCLVSQKNIGGFSLWFLKFSFQVKQDVIYKINGS